MKPRFFSTPVEFRSWLRKNHDRAHELLVGFHKANSAVKGITYSGALDEALCFGWIDGVRKGLDQQRYTIRFSPRKPSSIWSTVNIKLLKRLIKMGRMHSSGLAAFRRRDEEKTKLYSYENRFRPLERRYENKLKARKKGWDFFRAQPLGYQKVATWWIMSAKKEETRLRRLEILIKRSGMGTRLPALGGERDE